MITGNWLQDALNWYWITPWQLVLLETPMIVGSFYLPIWLLRRRRR